ncbi:MAG: hypothetical protein V9G24_11665 [Rhodoblastus sp.]
MLECYASTKQPFYAARINSMHIESRNGYGKPTMFKGELSHWFDTAAEAAEAAPKVKACYGFSKVRVVKC